MFKKRFAISLIVIATLVYGSIFVLAKQYGTSFFDEILIQLTRINTNINQQPEVARSKLILTTILENEHPPEIWYGLISHSRQNEKKELFYHYKIWTINTQLNHEDIKASYPISNALKNNINLINMRYSKTKPVLQFPFSRDKQGNLMTGLFFPINEKPMSADYNKDNTVNHEDVILARKK